VVNAAGFYGAGGFYVHHMKLIVVRKTITMGGEESSKNTKFNKVFQKAIHATIDVEDVIVHEMIHAISGMVNRSTRRYTSAEEEFVYTNSIDFYKAKGMSDEDIVNKNFLPFCAQDIFNDTKELQRVFNKCNEIHGIKPPIMDAFLTTKKLNMFLGRHAEKIVPILVDQAKELGMHMIDLYNKHGRGILAVSAPTEDEAMRVRSIDFDSEW